MSKEACQPTSAKKNFSFLDKNPDIKWKMPFYDLDNYELFPGYHWDVREVRIHADNTLSIADRLGYLHVPGSKSWMLAKAHLQSQMTFFGPGMAHNYVHFGFPTAVAIETRRVLSPSSVLRQLLEPHTRFTQHINYKALTVRFLC